MTREDAIINAIECAEVKTIGPLLERINREAFAENSWNVYSVKAYYETLLNKAKSDLSDVDIALGCGTTRWIIEGKENSTARVRNNLKIAIDFFSNPPVETKPNEENLNIDIEKNKYRADVNDIEDTIESNSIETELTPQNPCQYSENVRNGYAFGYEGVMEVFGWKRTKTWKVLKNKKYAAAIEQEGKKIAVNIEKMRELLRLSNKKEGAPRRR